FARSLSHRQRIRGLRIGIELRASDRSRILGGRSVHTQPLQRIRSVVVVVRKPAEAIRHSLLRVVAISIALGANDVALIAEPSDGAGCFSHQSSRRKRTIPI